MKKPEIILVDDHKSYREGISALLKIENIAEVVAEASNGKEFLELLETLKPDVVLIDIMMPDMNGIEATKKAVEINPALKIIALTSMDDEEFYNKMIEAGAKGFVMKSSGISEIRQAIKVVAEGESYFSNELLRRIIANKTNNDKIKNNFTAREIEVLNLICRGLSTDEIAAKLFISRFTVKGHRNKMLEKSGCNNTPALIFFAVKNKLTEV